MHAPRSKPTRTSLIAFGMILLPVAYVLSYAPVVHMSGFSPWSDELSVYRPVDWLLDDTPFYQPHLRWAKLWGVGEEFDADRVMLGIYRVETIDRDDFLKTMCVEIPDVAFNDEGRNIGIYLIATPKQHREVRALLHRLDPGASDPELVDMRDLH